MGKGMSMFTAFLEREYPGSHITELSGSNNSVFLVNSAAGALIAKHVTDADISLDYLATANNYLADYLPVQKIFRIYQQEQGDPFDGVLAEYVEGSDLATVLAQDQAALPADELAGYLVRFLAACRELPRMHQGFGLYKRKAPVIATYQEFLEHYARRYWGRARPFYAGSPIGEAVDEWIEHGLVSAVSRHPAPFAVVPVDANLKNFILTPDRGIVALNVPIAAVSTPAHAVAAVSVHLRNQPLRESFLAQARHSSCPDDFAMVEHFELWTLIGILSFYAVREPDRRGEWRDWGSPVPLDGDFQSLVQGLLLESKRR
jgi:hypothetical protein